MERQHKFKNIFLSKFCHVKLDLELFSFSGLSNTHYTAFFCWGVVPSGHRWFLSFRSCSSCFFSRISFHHVLCSLEISSSPVVLTSFPIAFEYNLLSNLLSLSHLPFRIKSLKVFSTLTLSPSSLAIHYSLYVKASVPIIPLKQTTSTDSLV